MTKLGRYFINLNPAHALIRKLDGYHNSVSEMHDWYSSDVAVNLYSIARAAHSTVAERLMNQSIILRGCSGSGKTETSKHLVQYLLHLDNPRRDGPHTQGDIYAPLGHATNPLLINHSCKISKAMSAVLSVLDYFGGAATDKNMNSSRLLRDLKLIYNRGTSYAMP